MLVATGFSKNSFYAKDRKQSFIIGGLFDRLKEDPEDCKDEELTFEYKQCETFGKAIHVAALHPGGATVLQHLLAARARVDGPCVQRGDVKLIDIEPSKARTKTHLPIHLAAAAGSVESLQVLLDWNADIDARSTSSGQEHYTALHEACYYKRSDAVSLLLERRANPDMQNVRGQTPLHICAKMESYASAASLVLHGANVYVRDWRPKREGMRALDVALESTSKHTEAHHFAARTVADVKHVAMADPDTAARLMKDLRIRKVNKIHRSWVQALLKPAKEEDRPCVDDFVDLMQNSPGAAADLLEILTVTPRVPAKFEYGLRRRTTRIPFERMRCEYRPENAWATVDGNVPEWHDRLVPRPVRSSVASQLELVHVQIRLLHLPGTPPGPGVICNSRVLYELAHTDMTSIFQKLATQAIIDYTWIKFVRKYYTATLVLRLLELLALFAAVTSPVMWESKFARCCVWSWCAATSLREVCISCFHALAYKRLSGSWLTQFASWRALFDALTLLAYVFLVFSASETMDLASQESPNPQILCIVVLLRWMQLIVMLHAYRYRWIGYELVPIIQSFFKVSGVALIFVMTLIGFSHSFLSLHRLDVEDDLSVWEIVLGVMRLLSMEDGVGVDMGTKMGAQEGKPQVFACFLMFFSVFVVCICILNIFIAVHGDQYQMAKGRVLEDFYSMRAFTCLNGVLDGTVWPQCLCRVCRGVVPQECVLLSYFVLMALALCTWFAMLYSEAIHAIVPSIILMLALRVGDQLLLSGVRAHLLDRKLTARTHPAPEEGEDGMVAETSGTQDGRVRYLWWAEWDCEEDEQDHLTSIAQDVHETKKDVERLLYCKFASLGATQDPQTCELLKRLERTEESMSGLREDFREVSRRLPR